MTTLTPIVELRSVTRVFSARPPVVALDSIDLTVGHGEYVAVTGTSGSGKSTLLNVIGLLDRPSTGCYRLCGHDVARWTESQLAGARGAWLGFVFQSFHLIPTISAIDNVMLASLYAGMPAAARRERAATMLGKVHLGHRATATPSTMSGGERQRVAIARALAHEPRVLLCDEPTGALDARNTASLLALLDELHEAGLTIILITHDQSVAEHAGRCIRIEDGRLLDGDVGR